MIKDFKKGSDQRFLAHRVWRPRAQRDCLQHDSAFGDRFGKTHPFPPCKNYPYKFLFKTMKPLKSSWKGLVDF
jgi:hypothetical protein